MTQKLTDSSSTEQGVFSTLSAAPVTVGPSKRAEGTTKDQFEQKAKDLSVGCKHRANHVGF